MLNYRVVTSALSQPSPGDGGVNYRLALWNFILDLEDICVFKMQKIFSIKENYKKHGIVTH